MKKRILLSLVFALVLVCALAVCVSARSNYREEHTYNYYDENGNLLYSATTIYAIDSKNSNKYRYEVTVDESEMQFAKVDENGAPLTWFVLSDDKGSKGDGTTNIVVASVPTADVGAVDSNGQFTYNNTIVKGITVTEKNVVSTNFFGMNISSFPDGYFMATATTVPNGSSSEYCQMTDGSYLLALYLPKTLTGIASNLCFRSPVRVLEFEDDMISASISISGNNGAGGPFAFCSNLKGITIPEGVNSIETRAFRECISLSYVKIPSTMTRLENNVFFRCDTIKTLVLSPNMVFAGYLNVEAGRFYPYTAIKNIGARYYYVPKTINVADSKFDAFRGQGQNVGGTLVGGAYNDLTFFFVGTLEEAHVVSTYTDGYMSIALGTKTKSGFKQAHLPVSYDEYLSDPEYYDSLSGQLLVYDVPPCVAFYDGEHNIQDETVNYVDAITKVTITSGCTRCDLGSKVEFAPLLTPLGYAAQLGGDKICLGYKVNKELHEILPQLSYGIVVTVPGDGDDLTAYEPLNPDLSLAVAKGVVFQVEKDYGVFELIVKGFSKNSEYYERPVVISAYVANGEEVDYISYVPGGTVVSGPYTTATSFAQIAEDCIEKYNVTYTCDPEMGTLFGETEQVVIAGEDAATVTATAKEGYTFAGWSDGTKTEAITASPEKDMTLKACFVPNSTGLPVMTINTENSVDILTKEYYINCEITLLDTETGKNVNGAVAEIKGRGNSTWEKFDKKPYKFKFDKKQNLFGYGNEKTWVLLADYRDYSLLRNMLAYDTALTMSELQETSQGQSVELYINGEYRGVYYLCEQIQVKENRVNVTEEDETTTNPKDIGYLVEMDGWAIENASSTPNVTKDGDIYVTVGDSIKSNRAYVVKDPEDVLLGNYREEFLTYVQGYLAERIALIQAGNDYATVCEKIDVKSFAQAYIIFELFKNPDTDYSSVYFHWDKDGKLYCGPVWDFDMAIGNVSHKGNGQFESTETLWSSQKNPWFKALLQFDEFKALVGAELADNEDNIRAAIAADLEYAKAHKDAYLKNFEAWDIMGKLTWSNPSYLIEIKTWEEHLVYIENYLEESLNYLIETYPAPSAE